MPTPDELRNLIGGYVAAINARQPGAIAALFTEDARQADPASNPPNIGRQAIEDFFRNSIAGSDSWTFTAERIHTCASTVAIDFRIELVSGGAPMSISGIEVFEVNDDGLFTGVNAYWDESDLRFD